MDENTLKNLLHLEQMFQHACQVCDALDYQIRQRNLLYTLANFLLVPLAVHREEEKKKNKDSKQENKEAFAEFFLEKSDDK